MAVDALRYTPLQDEDKWTQHASHNAQTFVARPLTFVHHPSPLSKTTVGISILSRPSLSSDRTSSTTTITTMTTILDKPLPPTPTADTHESTSPDSCPLLTDFSENVEVSGDLPSPSMIEQAADIPVLDAEGHERPFRSLYLPSTRLSVKKRVLVIFIRHFFCGLCQEYLRTLMSSVASPTDLPTVTDLVIVGCGSPSLIKMYAEATRCPYPIYAEPTRRLYKTLGMACTLSMGKHGPDYIQRSLASGMLKSFVQGVRRIGEGDAFKAGDMRQVGGEFLFEVEEQTELEPLYSQNGSDCGSLDEERVRVTWCHRMANSRDHTEIAVIRRVLGLSDDISDANNNLDDRDEVSPREKSRDENEGNTTLSLHGPQATARRWRSSLVQVMTQNHHHDHHDRSHQRQHSSSSRSPTPMLLHSSVVQQEASRWNLMRLRVVTTRGHI